MNTQLKTQTMQVQDETDDELYGSDGNFVAAGYFVRTHLRAGGQDSCDTSSPQITVCLPLSACHEKFCPGCL